MCVHICIFYPQFCLQQMLPQIVPQTMITNHYHNCQYLLPHKCFFFNLTIFQCYHKFDHTFDNKLLPQTTIIIAGSISTTTPIFVPIQQFFNFTTNFTTYFYHTFYQNFYHKLIQQTTIIIGGSLPTIRPIFVPIQQVLILPQILPHILPKNLPPNLPQTTTTKPGRVL